MNEHALNVLGFRETLDLIAGQAAGPLGAADVRARRPATDVARITAELQRVEEMQLFLRRSSWTAPAAPDLTQQLRTLAIEGSVWDASALLDGANLIGFAREARRAILEHGEQHSILAGLARDLVQLPREEERIRAAIDEGGEVRDTASRELAGIRREMRGARARIIEKLEQYMASLPPRFQVSDASVSIREGRFVVPVRREGRAEVGGIVHDESATGGTLFIEPPVAIELMNRLRELELAEAREVQRILRELTGLLRPHADALQASFATLIELDSLCARAKFASRYDAVRPEILPAGTREYRVYVGYHPYLLATDSNVVPFDLTLAEDERTLLVSGPNTGGKTVLLKAIGLISALSQSGFIPPVAAGTRLPVFNDIFADIGDEQSIEASLSTFSAHLKNIREILDSADRTSLVLMDEVGSGTDPAEGAALAQAVLVELTGRGAMTVATTHLGALKQLATEGSGVVNASLQFDAVELRPTYRLQKGIPGRSYGLAIARRLGFPPDVLARAEDFLPRSERDAAQLLLELEEKDRAISAALQEAEEARATAIRLRQELDEREVQVRRREKDAERRARQQARDIILASREQVENTIRSLREQVAAAASSSALEQAAREARRNIEEFARRQLDRMPEEESEPAVAGGALAAGARVRIRATGAIGHVLEVRDGKVVVETGGLRMSVAANALEVLPETEAPRKPRVSAAKWTAPEFHAASEIDLRGLRAEEVASQLEPAVDAAILAALPSLRIIHGKGTGALREVVSEILRRDPRVRTFRAGGIGEGGTGVTVAEFE